MIIADDETKKGITFRKLLEKQLIKAIAATEYDTAGISGISSESLVCCLVIM